MGVLPANVFASWWESLEKYRWYLLFTFCILTWTSYFSITPIKPLPLSLFLHTTFSKKTLASLCSLLPSPSITPSLFQHTTTGDPTTHLQHSAASTPPYLCFFCTITNTPSYTKHHSLPTLSTTFCHNHHTAPLKCLHVVVQGRRSPAMMEISLQTRS